MRQMTPKGWHSATKNKALVIELAGKHSRHPVPPQLIEAEAGGTGAIAAGTIAAGATGSRLPGVRGIGHQAGGEGEVHHKGALVRDGSNLRAQWMYRPCSMCHG